MIDGVEVSCVDFASPLVFVAAAALGKSGCETKAQLDADDLLFDRVERIRREAALRMGLGDVAGTVLPKVALVAPPAHGGSITSRYLTPWTCHSAHAVTGALCLAAACHVPGSVAAQVVRIDASEPHAVTIEHPAGRIATRVEADPGRPDALPVIRRAGVVRTARLLLAGRVYLPARENLALAV
jgi:4-oxalomesaconate tautomerase